MEEEPPIRITVYDKNYVRKGYVTSPNSVNIGLAWNAPGLTTFEVNASHSRVNDLVAEGARCVVEYRPEGSTWRTLMSGFVSGRRGSGGPDATVREFEVLDDLDELNHMVSYPVPSQPPSNQAALAVYEVNEPVESLIKTMVSVTVSGQSIPRLTVEPDGGAGRTIRYQSRMHNLGEYLLNRFATREGMGVRIVQTGTTRELQTWTPATFPRVLTEESGAVVGAEFSITPPEVTRVVVGIGGTGTDREFHGPPELGYADLVAESLWGIRRQEFIDARDIEKTDANKVALSLERAKERLDEGRAKTSLKAELSETGFFKFGIAFNLGDQVSVRAAGATVITDRVREVEIDWTADGGLLVTPRVGDWSDDPGALPLKTARNALRRVRDLGTR